MNTRIMGLLAVGLLVGPMVANAQIVVPWGTHDPGELGGTLFFGTGSSFPYEVIYTLTLTERKSVFVSAVTNDADGYFGINAARVRLYQNNGNANFNDDALVGDFSFDNASTSHTFDDLAAGAYYYKVEGSVNEPLGGSYLVSSGLIPPPAITPPACGQPPVGGGITVPWGNHDPGELGGVLYFGTGSSFPSAVNYTFTIGAPTDLLAVAVSNDGPSAFDINCSLVSLFLSDGDQDFSDDTFVDSFLFGGTSTSHFFTNLLAGSYYYRVTGQIDGSLGGSFLLSSAPTTAPVPEPGTLALLGLGLAGLGLSRRRKAS